MSSKTKLGKTTVSRGKGKKKVVVTQEETEYGLRFNEALNDIKELLDDEDLDDAMNRIQKGVVKAMPDYDIPKLFKAPDNDNECYDVTGQLVELVAFYKHTGSMDDAIDLFVESYKNNYRHVSRANPLLENAYHKVDIFRELEEVTEGQEGIGRCKICDGIKIEVKVKGTRSADEAMKVTYKCSGCKAAGKNIEMFKDVKMDLLTK